MNRYKQWELAKRSKNWCEDHYIHFKAMAKVYIIDVSIILSRLMKYINNWKKHVKRFICPLQVVETIGMLFVKYIMNPNKDYK